MCRKIWLFLLVLLVGLSACQVDSPSDAPSPVPAEGPAADVSVPLVVYERTSGAMGEHERWEIYVDGRVVKNDGSEKSLAPDLLMALVNQAEQVGFFEMEDVYLPEDPSPDQPVYALSMQAGEQMKTVVTMEGAPNQPPELVDLIQEVDRVVRQATALSEVPEGMPE